MQEIQRTIVSEHEFGFIVLALIVCALGSFTTMLLASRARAERQRPTWVLLGGLSLGATMWAGQLIALVGFRPDLPMAYATLPLSLSLIVSTIVAQLGVAVATRAPHIALMRLAGGCVLGLAAIILHYGIIAAAVVPGQISHRADYVSLSVLFALAFGGLAGHLGFARDRMAERLLGGAMLLVMFASLYAMAMTGLSVSLGRATVSGGWVIAREHLTGPVITAVFAVLATGIISALFDARMTRRTAEAAERFRVLTDCTFEGVLILRDGIIIDHNSAAEMLTRTPTERLVGTPFLNWVSPDDRDRRSVAVALTDPAQPCQTQIERPGGNVLDVEITGRHITLHDGKPGQVVAIRDISARRQSEERIRFLATHDPLTDLPNRRLFTELTEKVIAQVRRSGDHFAILVLDLDGFKIVNDTHGHDAGDVLIQTVARRISDSVRDSDVVARFGGDEFVILQTSTAQPTNALTLSRRLMDTISQPIRLADAEVSIGVSIGVALHPGDGEHLDDLLRNADTAMYRAKADGKGAYRFFEPAMDAELETRRRLESRMRMGIPEGRFAVHYQPLVACGTQKLLGFEALLRWTDPELGSVSPGEFIPVAEETGLIVPLGELVLSTACRDAAKWPTHLRVAVNLSPVQFRRPGLLATVDRALDESGLRGNRLELEITESLLIQDKDNVLRILDALRARGIRISMDDFGTGYSSLSYLQSFPFDKLKIDRTFVRNIHANDGDAAIVRAVAALGRSLNMDVVAEGVETEVQAEIVHSLSCDSIQGFLIAQPMTPQATIDFIHGWQPLASAGQ
ncbi:MAG: EAL domain-containing protein [Rhodospirillaceae bacterium]|nr:EAL domain-containing protein [Rhodospirillaceae bacterium]